MFASDHIRRGSSALGIAVGCVPNLQKLEQGERQQGSVLDDRIALCLDVSSDREVCGVQRQVLDIPIVVSEVLTARLLFGVGFKDDEEATEGGEQTTVPWPVSDPKAFTCPHSRRAHMPREQARGNQLADSRPRMSGEAAPRKTFISIQVPEEVDAVVCVPGRKTTVQVLWGVSAAIIRRFAFFRLSGELHRRHIGVAC